MGRGLAPACRGRKGTSAFRPAADCARGHRVGGGGAEPGCLSIPGGGAQEFSKILGKILRRILRAGPHMDRSARAARGWRGWGAAGPGKFDFSGPEFLKIPGLRAPGRRCENGAQWRPRSADEYFGKDEGQAAREGASTMPSPIRTFLPSTRQRQSSFTRRLAWLISSTSTSARTMSPGRTGARKVSDWFM